MSSAPRIYARALLEAAEHAGKVDAVQSELHELLESFAGAPDLEELLANPEVDSRVKEDVLARLAQGSDELVVNFLRLAAEKGRAAELNEIVAAFDALIAANEQVLDVELTTATELSEDEFDKILGRIETGSGHKVHASRKVDPDLIGGIVLQAGSMRLDASVRGRLERLRHDLAHARS